MSQKIIPITHATFSFSYPIFIVCQLCLKLELNIISFSCVGLSARLDWVESCVCVCSFTFFFFLPTAFDFFTVNRAPVHCSRVPQITLFSNFFIKNGSYNIIYTFKNYFATVFSVSAKINCIQTDPKCVFGYRLFCLKIKNYCLKQ